MKMLESQLLQETTILDGECLEVCNITRVKL